MSEKTAHLLEEFDTLPTEEKEAFAIDVLAHAQAQGLPVPLFLEKALKRSSSRKPSPSSSARLQALREWAAGHPITPPLSKEAISRESLYDDHG